MAKQRKKKRKKTPQVARVAPKRGKQAATSSRQLPWRVVLMVGVAVLVSSWILWMWSNPDGTRLESLALRPNPNVLLVSVDTLRADHLGTYGARVKTPVIDRLAEEGVVFEKTIASVPVTLPSHTSLFTGSYPIAHGVRDNGSFRLADEHETIAETFKKAGYETAAFIGSFALDSRFGLDQGFDLYDDYYGDTSSYSDFGISERPADEVLEPALEWMMERTEKPWFAFIHLWDPHHPYLPPSPFKESHPEDLYAGEIAYVDDALGRFLNELEKLNQLDNTLIVLTADHGEGLGDHGEKTHGMFAYESTLHVPLILHWNGVLPGGRRIPARVRLIDATPTVIELAGRDPLPSYQGDSLVPLILDPSGEEGRQTYFEAMAFNLNRNWAPLTGLYDGNDKYVDLPIPELYDLAHDPGELRNRADEDVETIEGMREILEGVIASNSTEESREIKTSAVDSETAARLQALGYVVDPGQPRGSQEFTEDDDPKRLVHLSDKLDEGVAYHAAGRSEEAKRLFREIIAERPSFSNAHANLAHVLQETGQLGEAIQVLENALEKGYQTRTMMGRLGLYLQESGDIEKSVQVLESVIETDPTYAEAYNYLSTSYAQLGRMQDAVQTVRKLLDLDPSYASGYSNLGSIFLGANRVEDAETNFRRALDLDPRLAKGWNGLGVVYARTGRQQEAIDAWKRTVELDPRQYDTIYNLGTMLTQLNRFDQAIPYLEQFVRTAPPGQYGDDIPKVNRLITQLKAAR